MITPKYLHNYAEWYYTKYFPSIQWLRDKLKQKTDDRDMIEQAIESISWLLVERQNIESRVNTMIGQGRTRWVISQKLLQKKFDRSLIAEILESRQDDLSSPETYRSNIELFIRKKEQKLSSKKWIEYELKMLYPESKWLISELLETYDDSEILLQKIPALQKRYTQEKMIQKCLGEWFRMNDIYTVLRRLQ